MKQFAPVLMLLLPSLHSAQSAATLAPASRYAELCASCHTADIASAFRSAPTVRSGNTQQIAQVIREGRPERGMPPFGRTLSESDAISLAELLSQSATGAARGTMIGKTIEAEALRPDRSGGFAITEDGPVRFLQYIDRGSHLCYENVDLTGVRSIEYRYAKGDGEPPRRFALLAYGGREFDGNARIHLGEKVTTLTGGWTTFRIDRMGLSRQLEGRHRLCFMGMGGGGVFNLDHFSLSDKPAANDGITHAFDVPDAVVTAASHSFRLEKVAEIDGELWSLDFLDRDTIVATQKSGSLWLFRGGNSIGPITGTPKVLFSGQAGLFTAQAHPEHHRNGWIYLAFAEPAAGGSMTTIVRGRIRGTQWVDEQVIYRAAPAFFVTSTAHYGGRLAFDGDHLFFGVGERAEPNNAQDLGNPFGKIHRVLADGGIPEDNPFVGVASAIASIWSYGHRNPQGLIVHPVTRELWATEHGPKGGDELNRILEGRNYGWPLVTFGTNYDGTIISKQTTRAGIESPRVDWTPSIGASDLHFYTADRFPNWRNHLLVASLAKQELRLVRVEGGDVVDQDVLIEGLGRVRDVTVGPDGYPYLILNQPNGMIYRMAPALDAGR